MFSRDDRGDDLFKNSIIDTSNPDKIIIREKSKPVRRRVKKGTKDQIPKDRASIKEQKKAEKAARKAAKRAEKEADDRRFDTLTLAGFDRVELEDALANSKTKSAKVAKAYKDADSSYKIPRLSEIESKKESKKNTEQTVEKDDYDYDLASEFRKTSADWRDADYAGFDDLSSESLSKKIKKIKAVQWIAAALAIIIFGTSIWGTSVYANNQCAERKEEAFAKLSVHEENTFEQIAQSVEDIEAPISLEEAKPNILKVLSLVLSSVEKDLKIKLVDEDDTLVKNVPWSVTLTDDEGNESEEADDDQDGIIHLTDISAGDYSVTLNPSDALSEYEIPVSAQSVCVKAKVEYKVIANIKDEIKTEKEINVAAEDTGGNQAAEPEAAPAPVSNDTVEFVESTKSGNGEGYEEATPDLTKTAKLIQSSRLVAALDRIMANAKSNFGNLSVGYPVLLACDSDAHVWAASGTYNGDGMHTVKCTVEDCGYEKTESCKGTGKCSICGHEEVHEHNFAGSITSNNDGTHKVKCTGCDETENQKCDTSGDSGACSGCGYKKQEEHVHSYTGSVSSNNDGTHKVKCTGCDSTNNEACDYDSNGKCKKCGYQKPTDNHTLTYTSNNNGSHKVSCSVAGCTTSGHNKANESCTYENNVCKFCKYAAKETASISLSGTTSIKVGETSTIAATLVPATAKVASASVDDAQIASATISGNNITVKGIKVGTAKLTVKGDNDRDTTITITVTDTQYADDAQLYDASKNALYVKEGDSYRLAKYKDYKNNPTQKFFRKIEEFLYTGWQTIDGKKCYYTKDHERVTGRQIISGVEYDFGADGFISNSSGTLGIDVSKYQPSINWSSVKSSGVDYVIIRCGYRGSSTGVLVEDPYFKSHIKGAKAAGLKVGVYFFTTATSEAEAVEEASMCAYLCNGYGLDMPIFMDCESSPRAGYNGMSASQRTAIIKAFCNTVRSAGYSAGVYANKTWFSSYINAGELSGYKIWLAQYNSAGPTYSGRYDIWQYTSKGKVNGISGYVDMNRRYY